MYMKPYKTKWKKTRTEHHFYTEIVADITSRN